MLVKNKVDIWKILSWVILAFFGIFLIYPLFNLFKQSVMSADGGFTLEHFVKFWSQSYYFSTLFNSVKVALVVTIVSLLFGVPLAYFYTFYRIKGSKLIYVLSILCCMSAPFIGAYSWILLLGRSGLITEFIKNIFNIKTGSIYGFKGIVLVQSLKLFPLVFIYMIGAFRKIDQSLLEAADSLGCHGVKRFYRITLMLTMPTILAASLLVFMRSFADFGTPLLIGEGYRTFPVEIYKQYLGETGGNNNFAAAISVISIAITALIFLMQKKANSYFNFTVNAMRPIEKIRPKKGMNIFAHIFTYVLIFVAFMPQVYVIYTSFLNVNYKVFVKGYSLQSYRDAFDKFALRSIVNTLLIGICGLILIIVIAVIIAYLVVRRGKFINQAIDTISMMPYIIPGSVVGIALVMAFNKFPLILTGTMLIMILAVTIRRLPYTIRSSIASLQQMPISIEEAAISLGASKMKTFTKIIVPMMSNGIISGAILSWVAIITELSSAIILYNTKTITLTLSTYIAVSRGSYGTAAAFATILTIFTTISLLIYMKTSREGEIT